MGSQHGDLGAVSNILEQYPDAIHEVDKNGAGALRYAAERGRVEVCRLLLEQNIDVNAVDTGPSGKRLSMKGQRCPWRAARITNATTRKPIFGVSPRAIRRYGKLRRA